MSWIPSQSSWIEKLFNLTWKGNLVSATWELMTEILYSEIWISLILILISFGIYMRCNLFASAIFLLVSGFVFYSLVPAQFYPIATILELLGLAQLFYWALKKRVK